MHLAPYTKKKPMDTFENANYAQEQEHPVLSECWECGQEKMCIEYIVCCTGTKFYTCLECKNKLTDSGQQTDTN